MHWLTTDPPYSQANVVGFCDRPFPDSATMNARLPAECRDRILDPALATGHAVVRDGEIVMADTKGTIVILREALSKRLPKGEHICHVCRGGYLSVRQATPPAGFTFDDIVNRSVPKEV